MKPKLPGSSVFHRFLKLSLPLFSFCLGSSCLGSNDVIQVADRCREALKKFASGSLKVTRKTVLEANQDREVILFPKFGVYYEPLDVGLWQRHDALRDIGTGVVTIISPGSENHQIFFHTHRPLAEVKDHFQYEVSNLSPGSKILDLGCGTGECVLDWNKVNVDAVGVDAYIPRTRRSDPRLKMSTIEAARYPKEHFDVIFASMSVFRGPRGSIDTDLLASKYGPAFTLGRQLTGLRSGWEPTKETLEELARILKPGGKIVFFPLTRKGYETELAPYMRENSTRLKLVDFDESFRTPYTDQIGLYYGIIQKDPR